MLAKLPSPRSIAAKMIRLGVVIRIISYRDTDAYVAIHCAIDSLQDSRLSIADGPIPPYRRYNAENVRAMGREKFRIPVRASIISRFQIYEWENSSHRHLFIVTGGNHLSSSPSSATYSLPEFLLVLYFFARVNASFNAAVHRPTTTRV